MNRILYSNLHIKFNPLINHVKSSAAKKKVSMVKTKQQKNIPIIIRKFSSYANRPPPPNNFWEMVLIASAVWIINCSLKPPPSGSPEIQNCI
jgi:hypothetical protein